jgi:hypothetical protein
MGAPGASLPKSKTPRELLGYGIGGYGILKPTPTVNTVAGTPMCWNAQSAADPDEVATGGHDFTTRPSP